MTGWGSLGNAKYDGFGLRAVRTSGSTIYSLYDGDTPVCALDSSGNILATYTMGPTGMVDFNAPSYGTRMNIYDPRGNAAETVSSAGAVLSSLASVDAFGQSSGGAFLFDTQHTFPTNQAGTGPNSLALGFREYDTTMGRFLKRDPMGYGGGINLYGYTQNNPVNGDDPEGLGPDPRYLGEPLLLPGVPIAPPGVDIRTNVALMQGIRKNIEKLYAKPPPLITDNLTQRPSKIFLIWDTYVSKVGTGHDWDYKKFAYQCKPTYTYDHFGNFNAGAAAAALGIPLVTAIFGADVSHFKHYHAWPSKNDPGDKGIREGYIWYIKTYGKVADY